MWQLNVVKILLIIVVTCQSSSAGKYWKRAPVHGAFNVDLYAYNKPVVNLAGQQPSENVKALPMGQLLEQLSHSSRREISMQKSHYRKLDDDNYKEEVQAVARVATTANGTSVEEQLSENLTKDLAINRQLAEVKNTHAMRNLYSHEFHVQNKGKRKIVLLNTLSNDTSSGQDRKPDSSEVMSEPLNLKLALPALVNVEEEEATTTTREGIDNWSLTSEAISTLQQMERNQETTTEQMPNKSHVTEQPTDGTDDNKHGPNDGNNMTTIEASNTANAADKEQQSEHKKSDTSHDGNDADRHVASVQFMPQSVAVAVADKPLTAEKSKRKQTRTKVKAKKTKRPNEIDTKPTSTSMMMVGTANVKAPVKEAPEITHTPVHTPTLQPGNNNKKRDKGKGKGKGKGKRKGSQAEQEIETTTNWWQILPYAEIRKFLNTIYDSIAEDDDERRQQRI